MAIAAEAKGSGDGRDAIKRRKQEERRILSEEVDVACGTLMSAQQHHLLDLSYKFFLVDEAAQATEPETVVALCLAELYARVACIGDQMQLPPTVVDPLVAFENLLIIE